MWSYHALSVSKCPAVMEESIKNQGIGVEGYHKVSKCQTNHEHITWGRKCKVMRLAPKTYEKVLFYAPRL